MPFFMAAILCAVKRCAVQNQGITLTLALFVQSAQKERKYQLLVANLYAWNINALIACVAGVKRGKRNLGVRPNSLPLPFRMPATQANALVA